ncbi:putative CDP-diacylglycerol--glycerol-3-phosphate 1-phosphatidyltransferase [Lupinus albus]|uniref:Putative CDP-diacylglycerol--glycerol-3-phosphate 1-phosphatidyltransferase n=1 Tax=Lupinus albus TaxID=3870 RepID=A0A6A4P649_LUPAL|nr:putative CDP-diacylglycerol--glycerol-3-phosphate 1-phosphatidyltransferase [Lupinus albus]
MITFYMDGWQGTGGCTTIFTAAAITDGFIARKMNLNSTFGAFLDPVADKLMFLPL